MKIAFLYEHPTWSDKLIQCFRDNDVELQLIDINELSFDTGTFETDFDLLVNRVNIMPSDGRDASVVFHTLHFLNWLETAGVRVINGAKAHYVGASKAMQNGLFSTLGLSAPKAIAIHRIQDALEAAGQIGYPAIVKPNIGGSGSDVARFDTASELKEAIGRKSFSLGVDGSGLVQEYINSDGFVYRVEVLGETLFYSIKQAIIANTFNYCAADGCSIPGAPVEDEGNAFEFCVADPSNKIQLHEVPDAVLAQVIRIVREAGADLGGVEYFIDLKTGEPCFYDFNPYSNFVSDGESLLGFSPEQRFVDFVKGLA